MNKKTYFKNYMFKYAFLLDGLADELRRQRK